MAKLGKTQHQVLVGLLLHGSYVWYLRHIHDTLDFYRGLVGDGLATEADDGDGRRRFCFR